MWGVGSKGMRTGRFCNNVMRAVSHSHKGVRAVSICSKEMKPVSLCGKEPQTHQKCKNRTTVQFAILILIRDKTECKHCLGVVGMMV